MTMTPEAMRAAAAKLCRDYANRIDALAPGRRSDDIARRTAARYLADQIENLPTTAPRTACTVTPLRPRQAGTHRDTAADPDPIGLTQDGVAKVARNMGLPPIPPPAPARPHRERLTPALLRLVERHGFALPFIALVAILATLAVATPAHPYAPATDAIPAPPPPTPGPRCFASADTPIICLGQVE